jgi:hypothetical protein
LLGELANLRHEAPPGDDPGWPFLLSAGDRRAFTANTIMRDPRWRMGGHAMAQERRRALGADHVGSALTAALTGTRRRACCKDEQLAVAAQS